jgi:hypothetical protein
VQETYTAFVGDSQFASGPLEALLPQIKARFDRGEHAPLLLIFEDQTGRQVDFDPTVLPPPRVGPGRPKLGVVSREISLLPRHWDWLEQQPNGASAALRRLVDQARAHEPDKQRARLAVEAASRFMTALAGNLPNYEEATRALYAGDRARFEDLIQRWPQDIQAYVQRLLLN